VTCGADIQEINTVRKHFSAVKGGRLAEAAVPARQITLYVSDVPEHLPAMVASGPTMPDETTLAECDGVLARYGLLEKFPSVFRALWEQRGYDFPETLKPGDPCFAQSRYYCLLSNWDGVQKLAQLAEAKGVIVKRDARCDDWDLRDAADYLLTRLEELREENPGKPVALISGGELSCPVTGDGTGGRNQAFVLDCVYKIAGQPVVVLSGGTDGIDGNSPACGAIADGESLARAGALGIEPEDYRMRSDSYHFFERLGDAIVTGPTGTNVRDLRMLLAY
jgi:hydroxypyruvate reductase